MELSFLIMSYCVSCTCPSESKIWMAICLFAIGHLHVIVAHDVCNVYGTFVVVSTAQELQGYELVGAGCCSPSDGQREILTNHSSREVCMQECEGSEQCTGFDIAEEATGPRCWIMFVIPTGVQGNCAACYRKACKQPRQTIV